jgi:CPA2 family monovalent cation:H+ antiporter-2
MPHDLSLIATIAAAFGLALVMGVAATRARMSPRWPSRRPEHRP